MSDNKEGNTGSSFWQLMLVIPGVIIGFTLVISILAYTFGGSSTSATIEVENAKADVAAKQAEANIKPVASVEVASDDGPKVAKTGDEVIKGACAMCHAAGLMDSPKLGDKALWAPRIAQGYNTLVKNAINGIRNMPARGGNPDLTDAEIASAVAIMANDAGANFDPASYTE